LDVGLSLPFGIGDEFGIMAQTPPAPARAPGSWLLLGAGELGGNQAQSCRWANLGPFPACVSRCTQARGRGADKDVEKSSSRPTSRALQHWLSSARSDQIAATTATSRTRRCTSI